MHAWLQMSRIIEARSKQMDLIRPAIAGKTERRAAACAEAAQHARRGWERPQAIAAPLHIGAGEPNIGGHRRAGRPATAFAVTMRHPARLALRSESYRP